MANNLQTFGEGVTEIQTTPAVTHLSFSDRKQAEAFYNGLKNGKVAGINDGAAPVEVSWVAGPAAALPGSTTSSVNTADGGGGGGGGGGNGLDSAMGDADDDGHNNHDEGDGGKADQHGVERKAEGGAEGESQAQGQNHTQQQQQDPGEAKEVDYDVAGENEWDE